MAERSKSTAEIVAAMCLHLPDHPAAAFNLALVACATVAIRAGESDEAAIDGLQAALGSLRETGLGEAKH